MVFKRDIHSSSPCPGSVPEACLDRGTTTNKNGIESDCTSFSLEHLNEVLLSLTSGGQVLAFLCRALAITIASTLLYSDV